MIEERFGATMCQHRINRAACIKCSGKTIKPMEETMNEFEAESQHERDLENDVAEYVEPAPTTLQDDQIY